jgi:hypothetical protein
VEGTPEENVLQGVSDRPDIENLAAGACGVVIGMGVKRV